MAITIDWGTKVISVPKADMTLVQSNPIEIRELNINQFHLDLRALEAGIEGMPFPRTHKHNTEVQLQGLTYARVVEIINGYTITFEDDAYAINVVGGNSNIGDVINFNQVSVRTANSGGMISNAAIEYASFNGGVILDVVNGVSGTVFPKGTIQMPVNNIADALLIADVRGFNKIFLHSDITINSGSDLDNFILEGQSHVHTDVVIESSASCENITIVNCDISGTLDGGTTIKNCSVGTLNYVNGEILNSGLYGTISLGGTEEAVIANCYTVDQDNPPVVDMGSSGQDLAMPNYSGIVTVRNLSSATEEIGIGLNGGLVFIDATITAGTVIVSGMGLVYNYSAQVTPNTDGLMNKQLIADAVWDADLSSHTATGSMGKALNQLFDESGGKREIVGTQEIFYKADGTTEIMRFNLFDSGGNPSATNVYKRERV